LDLIIANHIYHKYPDQDEGFLTKLKTRLVNGTQLAKIARKIGLGQYILMSNHVEKTLNGRDSQRILEDAFEAFLAALFKDLGFDAVNSYIVHIINQLDFSDLEIETNYKDMLMKYAHKFYNNTTPEYTLLEASGQSHERTFKVVVTIGGQPFETGIGKSKKQAEQNACENTLKKLGVIQ